MVRHKDFQIFIKKTGSFEPVFLFNFVKKKYMCNKNINSILNLNFSSTNDEFNWLSNSSTPISTNAGQLVLQPESTTTTFRRGLGTIDPTNNRIRLQINMDLFRPTISTQDTIKAWIGIYAGTILIGEFSIYRQGMTVGEKVQFNFDREFIYESISGNISLKINFTEGFENQLLLDYLKCDDFNFCQEEIRTYFVLNQFLENSLNATSSGIQLLEWKVDNAETLTPEFFAENINPGGTISTRKFAKAKLDGSNRVFENTSPNTFNPFVNDLGLKFDDINSFYGGKAIGTNSGSNYGNGILNLGFEKPEILNGTLNSKKGAFFIDIDFTKDLKIVFNVLVNNTSESVFNNPSIFRKYFILWNSKNCQKSFYYQDLLSQSPTTIIPVDNDGFLFGLTNGTSIQTLIQCNELFSFEGNPGTYEFQIDFGQAIGIAGINYHANDLPDKFEIEWNGQVFSSGFVGSDLYDQQLINNGINPTEIQTSNPSNGSGVLSFFKSQEFPTIATIRVTSPLENVDWNISGICTQSTQEFFTEIVWDDTQTIENRFGNNAIESIYIGGVYYPTTNLQWQRNNGSGWVDNVIFGATTQSFNLVNGLNQFRMKALNSFGVTVYSNILKYTKGNITTPLIYGLVFPIIDAVNNLVNAGIDVHSDGGTPLIEVGLCFNQTGNPTINDLKIIYDPITGYQYKDINLPNDGGWYFSAYAINAIGITYFSYPTQINL